MKVTDAKLIEALNTLPKAERDALLEFLGAHESPLGGDEDVQDWLEFSAELHRKPGGPGKN